MVISTKFTHADLLALPEDNKRREIIDGDLFVTPTPRIRHQRIVQKLARAFERYLEQNPLGELFYTPVDIIFSDLDVLEPDLFFVSNEKRDILQDWVRGVPDLVVEILSPTTAARDRGIKLKAYARFGVREYWIVDPEAQAIELYRLAPEGYELTRTFRHEEELSSPLLPGFALPVGSIFQS
ncbi:MAG: Uma2 family endonuclease [Acidobacteria bacterium]|nr:Uma2 family endonuclease [Acidobacteriota bacterium]